MVAQHDSDAFHAPPTTTAALTAYYRQYGASNAAIELVHFQGPDDIAPWLEHWLANDLATAKSALAAGEQPIVGFSFYTWNAAEFLATAAELKAHCPTCCS